MNKLGLYSYIADIVIVDVVYFAVASADDADDDSQHVTK